LQQTLEKTPKAWLRHLGVKPPQSHDIARLLVLLEQAHTKNNAGPLLVVVIERLGMSWSI